MKFTKATFALGLGLASTVLAIPQNSVVSGQQAQGPNDSSSSSSTSSSSTSYSNSNDVDTSDSEGDDGSLAPPAYYYVTPQGNANAMMVNQIPGQAQSGKTNPLSLAGSKNLNTYSYETGQGNPYANSGTSFGRQAQFPDVYSAASGDDLPDDGFGSYGLGAYDLPDYEALYGPSGYGSPLQQIPDGQVQVHGSTYGSHSASSTNAYGEGQSRALTDTTYAVGTVPHEYTATPTSEVQVVSASRTATTSQSSEPSASSQAGEALVSSVGGAASYEGNAARNNVATAGIVIALFAMLMG